jgi:cytochrome b
VRRAVPAMNVAGFPTRQPAARTDVQVWDIGVRVFHWSLAATATVALLTGLALLPTWITLHLVAGTAAVALVVARVVWGVWGPGPARFTSFVQGPRALLEHCRALAAGTAHRHLGHNPLGGAMIVALIAAVVLLALTGVVAEGGALKSGPLAFMTTFAVGWSVRQLHSVMAYVLLGLVVLHVAGVVFESRRSRENLVRAMVDGHKPARPGDIAPPRAAAHPVLAAAVATVLLVAGTAVIVALAQRPGLGTPRAPIDPLYDAECGECHIAYHPSLLPAVSWSAIMADLSHHFGDNASLDAATADRLRTYLLAHSAEHYDTLPANRFRQTDPAAPLRITATPFWQRRHHDIPDSVFAAPQVRARSNCGACHEDAAGGLFAPSAIAIPEDAEP